MYNKINHEPTAVILYSDSSDIGCGAHTENKSTDGNWSVDEFSCHINRKEMLTVVFPLKSLAKKVSNLSVKN